MFPLEITECRSRRAFEVLAAADLFRSRSELERHIAERAREQDFRLPGWCRLDDTPVDFLADWNWAVELPDGSKRPNWRETLICPRCGLNNRQRAIAGEVVKTARRIVRAAARPCRIFAMEQVSPLFRLFSELSEVECIGSEYLGPDRVGGEIVDGIRHEDAEALSFADASFDLVSSNDVFEHVDEPRLAFREACRVLVPGGEMLFSVPFHAAADANFRRARLEKSAGDGQSGELTHLAPPAYHGNPLSPEGSLVFTDFGWEMVSDVVAAGFARCTLQVYWSLELGHLGGAQFFFRAVKSGPRG